MAFNHPHTNFALSLTAFGSGSLVSSSLQDGAREAEPSIQTSSRFGCPRTGNTAFAARVAGGGRGHFRCVNFNDLVTHIPLESALYLHAPDLEVVERLAGGLPADLLGDPQKLDELPAPPGLVDHSPARYCVRLWNCV